MRAWQLTKVPGQYQLTEVPTPAAADGEVLVKVSAVALNHLDLWVQKGEPAPVLPHIGGADATGIVEAVGGSVDSALVGRRVVVDPLMTDDTCEACISGESSLCDNMGILGEHRSGTFADYVVLPARNVVPLSDEVSDVDGAAFGLVTMTALRMIRRARLKPGMRVLITGAGGGVASTAIALCAAQGLEVVASSRRPEVLTAAIEWGASEVVAPEMPFDPIDAVLDSVGPALWPWYAKRVKSGGRIVIYGSASGPNLELSLVRHFFRQHELIGTTMGSHDDFAEAVSLVEAGFRVPVSATYPFENLDQALLSLERAEQIGKIVLLNA